MSHVRSQPSRSDQVQRTAPVTGAHISDANRCPHLAEAERELVLAAKSGNQEASDALVDAFVPRIGSVARLYRGSAAVNRGELMQEGVVGLLRALKRYDTTLDTPFWAYASWWVRQAMQQLVSQLTRPVVLSDRASRQLTRVRDARREHLQSHGSEPTCDQLAAETHLGRSQVEDLIVAERRPRALDEPLGGDGELGATLGDLLADPHAEDAYERVPQHMAVEALPGLLEALGDRERRILCARFGLDGPEHTLREVGGELGVSAERVRQLEERALDKLRAAVDDGFDRRVRTGSQRAAATALRRGGGASPTSR
jgi:RNA polymerase primary sigma factor